MPSLSKSNIYEAKTVYGDESKFGKNSDRLEKMLRFITSIKPTPKKILDIGCGNGFLTHKLKIIFPESDIIGIDISKTALSEARKKYTGVTFIYADAEIRLPFKDNYFDLLVSGEHIEHVADTDTCLAEMNRVLKIGGDLLITTPNLASWFNRILLLYGKQPYKTEASFRYTLPILSVLGVTFPQKLTTPASGHLRVLTLDMLTKLLKVYGFKIQSAAGRTMLTKPLLRQFDQLISNIPTLASGLIVSFKKTSNTLNLYI